MERVDIKNPPGKFIRSGGHFPKITKPKNVTFKNIKYTLTYTDSPKTPNKPFKTTVTMKDPKGVAQTVKDETWSRFPNNWTNTKTKKRIKQDFDKARKDPKVVPATAINGPTTINKSFGFDVEVRWELNTKNNKCEIDVTTVFPK